jgi:hypothetical protein
MTNPLLLGFMACPVSAGDDKTSREPSYDPSTVIDVAAVVTEVAEAPASSPMEGLHLTVKAGSDTLDVYVGPSDFVKIFDVSFAKGAKIQVIGSKVEFNGAPIVLARQITMGHITLALRDKDGVPFWRYWRKPPQG